MPSENQPPSRHDAGLISAFLTADHRRLDALFAGATQQPDVVDLTTYAQFRAALLRHISMEEKVLLPAVQAWRDGEPLPIAARLRLDHGALAALLVPSPTPGVIRTLAQVLSAHNRIEEGPDGVYASCDALAGTRAAELVERLRAVPEVPMAPHSDSPLVIPATVRALARAGYVVTAADLQ